MLLHTGVAKAPLCNLQLDKLTMPIPGIRGVGVGAMGAVSIGTRSGMNP